MGKEKNVLMILTIWNEMDYLPLKLQFCKDNKLDLYVIDNMSDDGSWEWLQEHNIPSHRFDTNGGFHLRLLQDEILRTIHKLKPYWVIYNGCDLFPVTMKPLYDELMLIDEQGFNQASIDFIGFANTGEEVSEFDPFNTYFYHWPKRELTMIHKYHPDVKYNADAVFIPNSKIKKLNGVMINYGETKPFEERLETLKRRQKAWDEGESRGHGVHYMKGLKCKWIRDKKDLIDVREGDLFQYVKKLQEVYKKL